MKKLEIVDTLRGKPFAGRKFRNSGQIPYNLTREKYSCKILGKFIPHEMNFKGQLDKS